MNDLREITGWPRTQVRQQPGLPAGQPPGIYDLDEGYGQSPRSKEVTLHGKRQVVHPRAGPR
jgi:hypothetical protein